MSSLLILYQFYLKFNLKHHIPLILNMKKCAYVFRMNSILVIILLKLLLTLTHHMMKCPRVIIQYGAFFCYCGRSISENSNRTKPDNNWITNRIKLTLKCQGNVWDNKYQYFNNIGPPEKNWHGEKHDK